MDEPKDKTTRRVIVEQLEMHFSNFVYVFIGILVFIMMYFMSDCMYTKEVGLMILGWLGVLISGKRSESSSSQQTVDTSTTLPTTRIVDTTVEEIQTNKAN